MQSQTHKITLGCFFSCNIADNIILFLHSWAALHLSMIPMSAGL